MNESSMIDVRNIGLRGVTVADSKISLVDGQNGRLLYRGYAIEDLAERASFEEVVYLLLNGTLPTRAQLEATRKALSEARQLPKAVVDGMRTRPRSAQPMDVLQGAVTALADHDPKLGSMEREDLVAASLVLVSRIALVVAAWHQIRQGKDPVEVDRDGSHAAAFLQALWGRRPNDAEERLMDALLVLHAEHTLNASTFAAREVASTQAHLYAAVASAVGSLSGPLHGAANARVMDMLLGIGSIENVESWVRNRIESGQRVMGLGHAVYKTVDPRANILRKVAGKALEGKDEEKWYHLGLKVEETAHRLLKELKGLELYPNVDFFSGPILYALGLATDMFPPFFAVSRASGWTAHVIEEQLAEAQPKPALYRPKAQYTGRYCGPQGCEWIPLESRGYGCPCGKDHESCDEAAAVRDVQSQRSARELIEHLTR